jgi:hypothetical protein
MPLAWLIHRSDSSRAGRRLMRLLGRRLIKIRSKAGLQLLKRASAHGNYFWGLRSGETLLCKKDRGIEELARWHEGDIVNEKARQRPKRAAAQWMRSCRAIPTRRPPRLGAQIELREIFGAEGLSDSTHHRLSRSREGGRQRLPHSCQR